MFFSVCVDCRHFQGVNGCELCRIQSAKQVSLDEIIHQKSDGATVHAINRHAGGHHFVHGLQHVTVTAQGHHNISVFEFGIAI